MSPRSGLPSSRDRLVAVDRLRGLLIVLMALDHAAYFIARVHPFEGWNSPPPWYGGAAAFATRWVTHLCAPGFFMLMGAGMVWFAYARRQAGWSAWRTRRFFLTRGLVLVLLQQLGENPTWLLSTLSSSGHAVSLPPGGGTPFFLHLGVLNALGLTMIAWACLIGAPALIILAVTIASTVAGLWMTPSPDAAATLFSPAMRLLFVPGHTNFINVMYPWIPWLAPAGVGVLLGRRVLTPSVTLAGLSWRGGLLFLVAFVALRAAGLGDVHAVAPTLEGWLAITKYPPSPCFLLLTLGLDLLLLAAFAAIRDNLRVLRPLEIFGRTPLCFYLAHLWLLALAGFALAPNGFGPAYAAWILALMMLLPVCTWFDAFKARTRVDSVWRLL